MERVVELFLTRATWRRSTEGPWESYLANGLNYTPLVWVYEAQYVGPATGRRRRDPAGLRAGLPVADGAVQAHAGAAHRRRRPGGPAAHRGPGAAAAGRRSTGSARRAFDQVVGGAKVAVPQAVTDVIDPPAFEIQEAMLDVIARRYK